MNLKRSSVKLHIHVPREILEVETILRENSKSIKKGKQEDPLSPNICACLPLDRQKRRCVCEVAVNEQLAKAE